MCQFNFLILESEEAEKRILEIASSCDFHFQYVMTNFSNLNLGLMLQTLEKTIVIVVR